MTNGAVVWWKGQQGTVCQIDETQGCLRAAFADGESVFFYPSCFADGTLTRTEKQAE